MISDIHGEYDMFINLLEKIGLSDFDTLYVLGDVLDRGPHPIKTLLRLMEMPNAICIIGNHELMALECLPILMKQITSDSIAELDDETANNIISWMLNGSDPTISEFRELENEQRLEVIEFLKDFSIFEQVSAGGKDYLLVHAGLGNFSPHKDIYDYSLKELVWDRADYEEQYFPDKYVVTGHTPTQVIEGNPKPGFILRRNNHIAIDCGAHRPHGRLAAICLDTGEEYYCERLT